MHIDHSTKWHIMTGYDINSRMIRGITKSISHETALISDEQRRTAAGLYIAGMDALFTKFDPETDGNDILLINAPLDNEDSISVVAERRAKILQFNAPDGQMHSYGFREDNVGIWRDDGRNVSTLGKPDARINRHELSDIEALAQLKRIAAERDALHLHEPSGMFVDGEEVQKLFSVLMQGQVNKEA